MARVYISPTLPVTFNVNSSVFSETQWRMVRAECKKLSKYKGNGSCNWSFNSDGTPNFPARCSRECFEYLTKGVDEHE